MPLLPLGGFTLVLGLPVSEPLDPPPLSAPDDPAPLLPAGGVYAWVPLLNPPLLVAARPLPEPPACPLAALLAPDVIELDLFEAATPPPVPEFWPEVAYGDGLTLL